MWFPILRPTWSWISCPRSRPQSNPLALYLYLIKWRSYNFFYQTHKHFSSFSNRKHCRNEPHNQIFSRWTNIKLLNDIYLYQFLNERYVECANHYHGDWRQMLVLVFLSCESCDGARSARTSLSLSLRLVLRDCQCLGAHCQLTVSTFIIHGGKLFLPWIIRSSYSSR